MNEFFWSHLLIILLWRENSGLKKKVEVPKNMICFYVSQFYSHRGGFMINLIRHDRPIHARALHSWATTWYFECQSMLSTLTGLMGEELTALGFALTLPVSLSVSVDWGLDQLKQANITKRCLPYSPVKDLGEYEKSRDSDLSSCSFVSFLASVVFSKSTGMDVTDGWANVEYDTSRRK